MRVRGKTLNVLALSGAGSRLTADLWLCYTRPVRRPAGI